MHSIRRVTDSVRVRVTVLATFLVAVVLIVGAMLLTRAVEGRLVSDRERAATEAVGATVDQVEKGVPLGAIVHQTFDQQAGVGIFTSTGAPVGGEFNLPITNISVLPPGSGSVSGSSTARDQVIFIAGVAPQDVAYDAAPVAVGGGNFFVVGMASLAEVRHSMKTLWSGLAARNSARRARCRPRCLVPGRAGIAASRGDAPGGRDHLGDDLATPPARTA